MILKLYKILDCDALYFPSISPSLPSFSVLQSLFAHEFVKTLSLNKMDNNNNKSAPPTVAREEKQAASVSLLKALEDMLHNKIKQKKEEIHKTKNIAENDKLSIEIGTLHWVLSQCLSIRRLLKGQESELSYDTTISKGLMME
jgi:hypothetical protein